MVCVALEFGAVFSSAPPGEVELRKLVSFLAHEARRRWVYSCRSGVLVCVMGAQPTGAHFGGRIGW